MTIRRLPVRPAALFALAVLALAFAAPVAPAAADTTAKGYTAKLVNDDPRLGRRIETLTLSVDRLSTAEELAAFAAGTEKAGEVGSAKLNRTLARAAVAAFESQGNGVKTLTVVFDKPLNWFDSRNVSAKKYPYGVIQIEMNGEAFGKGTLITGAEVKFGADGIEIVNAGGEPMRLVEVAAAQG